MKEWKKEMKAIKQQQQQCKYHGDYTTTLWEHDVTYGITETWSDCPYCVEDRRNINKCIHLNATPRQCGSSGFICLNCGKQLKGKE